jgi:hypothetical protein
MIRFLSFLTLLVFVLSPFWGIFFIPYTLENDFISLDNYDLYIYSLYGLYWFLYIATLLSIKYLFGGDKLRLLIVFAVIAIIPSTLITSGSYFYNGWIVYFSMIAFYAFSYWLIHLPSIYIRNKKENNLKEKITPKLYDAFREEIILKYEKKFEALPHLAWNDYTLLGYLFARLTYILDKELYKIQPDYDSSFSNKNYQNLYDILSVRVRSQYPQSSHISISYSDKSKDGFKKGMYMDEKDFEKYLEYLNANYSRHPDKIDRSNMIPETSYNIEKGLKTAHSKVQETIDGFKGSTKLKKRIEELKSLKDEETIDEKEYLELRKKTLEKYVSEKTKDTSVLKSKLKEVEDLKEEDIITKSEFDSLRKLIIDKYA